MTWIEDGLKREKAANDRSEKISAHALNVYNDLWQEIDSCVAEAKKGGIPVTLGDRYVQGDRTDREVRLSFISSTGESSSTLHVRLSGDRHSIEITRDSESLRLELDLCNDKPCLKHDKRTVTIAKAAQLILEPFFFSV